METPKLSGPRACRACAGSKARCIFPPESSAMSGKCQRCNRLNKDCTMQNPAVRKSKPSRSTRVAQLESKLDNLVSLVQSSQLVSEDEKRDSPASTAASSSTQAPSSASHPSSQTDSGTSISQAGPAHYDLPQRDPDSLLTVFREELADQFPFVIIPPAVTAHDLGQSKPILLKTILMVTSFHDKTSQVAMAHEIMEYYSLHILLKAEKSLELLQSLLVSLAWFHVQVHIARRTTLLLQLATSLALDLDLTNEPRVLAGNDRRRSGFRMYPEDLPGSWQRTLEERRAYLGLYYLNSVISVNLMYMDTLRYNRYTENCVRVLEESSQYPSDEYLVQLMRLQQIVQEISQAVNCEESGPALMPSAPISVCMRTLQAKLQTFRSKMPHHLETNPFLLMHYHSVLIYLTETALFVPLPSRQAILHACLTSTQSFFSLYLSIPLDNYHKITYVSGLQLTYALTVLDKLSHTESDDWDSTHVQGVVNISLVLDGIIARFEAIEGYGRRAPGDTDLLTKFLPMFRYHRQEVERKRAALMTSLTDYAQMEFSPVPHSDIGGMSGVIFSDLDDAFWQEIIVDFPEQGY